MPTKSNPYFKVTICFENSLKLTYRGRFESLDQALSYYRQKHYGGKVIEVKQLGRVS